MRLQLIFAGALALGLSLVGVVACSGGGDGSAATANVEDAGVRPPPTGSDADPPGPDGGLASSTGSLDYRPELVADGDFFLIATTADDHAIVVRIAETASLEAVPIGGGEPIVISDTFEIDDIRTLSISGSAVAWWTNVSEAGVGTAHVWTKATGTKPLSATSLAGFLNASRDGARVMYGTDATVTDGALVSTDVVVGALADLTAASPGLFPANKVNMASAAGDCAAGGLINDKLALLAFCAGTAADAIDAQLHVIPLTGAPFRVDDVGAAAGPVASEAVMVDQPGTRLMAWAPNVGPTTGRIIDLGTDAATTTSHVLDTNITQFLGFLDEAGTTVLYATPDGLRRASSGPTPAPETLVAEVAGGVDNTSRDRSRVVFHTKESAQTGGTDILTANTATSNQTPVTLVGSASAGLLGAAGLDGNTVFWVEGESAETLVLTAMAAEGGPKRSLIPNVTLARIAPENPGAAVALDVREDAETGLRTLSLRYVDGASGESTKVLSSAILLDTPSAGHRFHKKNLVYVEGLTAAAGLYRVALP